MNAIAPNSVIWFNAFGGKQSRQRVGEALRTLEFDATIYKIASYGALRDFYRNLGIDPRTYLT